MKQSKIIATCGMMAALAIVIMIVGGFLGIGMYASPMFAGLSLVPIGEKFGKKYHICLWLAVSMLSFMLVPEVEQNLMFLCVFGSYPILYSFFQKLSPKIRIVAKLLYFNIVIISLEYIIVTLLVPEVFEPIWFVVLLLVFNFIFLCYDKIIPNTGRIMKRFRTVSK